MGNWISLPAGSPGVWSRWGTSATHSKSEGAGIFIQLLPLVTDWKPVSGNIGSLAFQTVMLMSLAASESPQEKKSRCWQWKVRPTCTEMSQRDVGRAHRVSATALKVEPTSSPTLQMKRHVEFALQKEKRSPPWKLASSVRRRKTRLLGETGAWRCKLSATLAAREGRCWLCAPVPRFKHHQCISRQQQEGLWGHQVCDLWASSVMMGTSQWAQTRKKENDKYYIITRWAVVRTSELRPKTFDTISWKGENTAISLDCLWPFRVTKFLSITDRN